MPVKRSSMLGACPALEKARGAGILCRYGSNVEAVSCWNGSRWCASQSVLWHGVLWAFRRIAPRVRTIATGGIKPPNLRGGTEGWASSRLGVLKLAAKCRLGSRSIQKVLRVFLTSCRSQTALYAASTTFGWSAMRDLYRTKVAPKFLDNRVCGPANYDAARSGGLLSNARESPSMPRKRDRPPEDR